MKLTPKTLIHLVGLFFLGFVSGSLVWEAAEVLASLGGMNLGLRLGPAVIHGGFVELKIFLNPGGILGCALGVSAFLGAK